MEHELPKPQIEPQILVDATRILDRYEKSLERKNLARKVGLSVLGGLTILGLALNAMDPGTQVQAAMKQLKASWPDSV